MPSHDVPANEGIDPILAEIEKNLKAPSGLAIADTSFAPSGLTFLNYFLRGLESVLEFFPPPERFDNWQP